MFVVYKQNSHGGGGGGLEVRVVGDGNLKAGVAYCM